MAFRKRISATNEHECSRMVAKENKRIVPSKNKDSCLFVFIRG
jgi:hypothetical protein